MPAAAPQTQPDPDPGAETARILARLAERHSCRDFDGTAMDTATLEAIIADGVQAPSSCNHQNWHFILVTDPDRRRMAHDIAGGNPHFASCSALIYLCFQKGWTHGNFSIVQSVAGAAYHMMLSAHLRGYQAIWNAGIGDQTRLHAMLDLPPTFELIGALAIGRGRPSAPAMKAPRRPVAEVFSHDRFERPARAVYPARPARSYPYFRIRNTRNPFAQWAPARWTLTQIADFRGYAVWAKSPLAGVYVSRRQGAAAEAELALLPDLPAGAHVAELMPWGGTPTVALRRRLGPEVRLTSAELAQGNLDFIAERLRQEGLGDLPWNGALIDAAGRLPLADASMDAVVAQQVLEHLPDPAAMLDEALRILRPGGALVVSARNLRSLHGLDWALRESRAQIPNQGPFRPIPAPRLRRWLADRFTIETDTGIGLRAAVDSTALSGRATLWGRLYAARCRKGGGDG